MCTVASHEALKTDTVKWYNETVHVGEHTDEEGVLEVRNCKKCRSTLARMMGESVVAA